MSEGLTLTGKMIDTETLALGPRALIWEIACVPFEIEITSEGASYAFGSSFHAIVDYSDLSTRGFDIDLGTVNWTNGKRAGEKGWEFWRDTHLSSDALKAKLDKPGGVRILKPASIIAALANMYPDAPVWFRNAAFDVPAIENLVNETGDKMPWHRRQQSDLYTQINVAKQLQGYDDTLPAVAGHRALEDAIGQIGQLTELCGLLYRGSEPKVHLEL